MKFLLSIVAVLFLTACTTAQPEKVIIVQKEMIKVPDRYLTCEKLKKEDVPVPEGLTDKQVALFAKNVVKKLNSCAANTAAIKKLQENNKPPQKP